MAVHGGAELQLATQLGMIDDVGAVGLQHILKYADGLGVIILVDGLLGEPLVTEESRRERLGMLTGDIVQVVGLHMA